MSGEQKNDKNFVEKKFADGHEFFFGLCLSNVAQHANCSFFVVCSVTRRFWQKNRHMLSKIRPKWRPTKKSCLP
jgi:hypothetical protein